MSLIVKRPGMYKRGLAAIMMILICLFPVLSLADGNYSAVSGGSLNLRETASLSASVLGQYPTGTWVQVLETGDTFTKVLVNGKTGYMMSKYLTNGSGSVVATRYIRTNTGIGLNLRQSPTESGTLITSYPNGTKVDVLVKGVGWHKVQVNGQIGYMSSKYLFTSGSGGSSTQYGVVQNPNSSVLNLRESASLSSAVLKKVANGTSITILQTVGAWYKVQVGDKTGYMIADYVKVTGNAGTATVKNPNGGSIVNFRTSANLSASIISKLPVGTAVTVLDRGTDWTQVKVNDTIGYISTWFLRF